MKTEAKNQTYIFNYENQRRSKLFEINATRGKQFYVIAKSKDEAIELSDDETRFHGSEFDWEHIETTATEITGEQAEWIKKHRPNSILKSL